MIHRVESKTGGVPNMTKIKSTRQLRQIHRAYAIGMTITPKPSEIQGIPLEGSLAFWHDEKWWTPGAMKGANLHLDLNGILGIFGLASKVWKVRVWTAAEATRVFNDLTGAFPVLA
jgi:hypothetical protein